MYFVVDKENFCAKGNTLAEAYNNFVYNVDNLPIEELTFYEGKEIKVKQKIEKVEKVTITKRN